MNKRDSVKTPVWLKQWVTSKYGKWWDPVPFKPSWDPAKNFNALVHEWKTNVIYMNSPYSTSKKFLERAVEQRKPGRTIICLTKTDIMFSTYFEELVKNVSEIFIIYPRIKFPGFSKGALFMSMLLVMKGTRKVENPKVRLLSIDEMKKQ